MKYSSYHQNDKICLVDIKIYVLYLFINNLLFFLKIKNMRLIFFITKLINLNKNKYFF